MSTRAKAMIRVRAYRLDMPLGVNGLIGADMLGAQEPIDVDGSSEPKPKELIGDLYVRHVDRTPAEDPVLFNASEEVIGVQGGPRESFGREEVDGVGGNELELVSSGGDGLCDGLLHSICHVREGYAGSDLVDNEELVGDCVPERYYSVVELF